MKTIRIVATLISVSIGCSSPLEPSAQSGNGSGTGSGSGLAIASLSPASGPIGTRVTVRGSGFAASDNIVAFAAMSIEGETPNEPTVVPGLLSSDGTTISFDVLANWRPRCSYLSAGPCPFARIPTAPGTYQVTVSNTAGMSNGATFTVTR